MLRKDAMALLAFLITVAVSISAFAKGNFYYDEVLDIPVKKLIICSTPTGTWDHNVYLSLDQNHYLVVVCHGVETDDSSYKIQINNKQRSDYAEAVEEILQRWEREGYIKSSMPYDKILLHTCFSGKAPYKNYHLTNFHHKTMTIAIRDHRGYNAHSETKDRFGNMRLQLYRAYPKSISVLGSNIPRTASDGSSGKLAGRNIIIDGPIE